MTDATITFRAGDFLSQSIARALASQDLDLVEARSTDDGNGIVLELRPRALAMRDLIGADLKSSGQAIAQTMRDAIVMAHRNTATSPPPTDDGDERIVSEMPEASEADRALKAALDANPGYADVITALLRPMLEGRGLKPNPVHGSIAKQIDRIAEAFHRQPKSRLRMLATHVNASPGRIWLPSLDDLYTSMGLAIVRGNLTGETERADAA
jgi:hypothetical protein